MRPAARPPLPMPTPDPIAPPSDFTERLRAIDVELGPEVLERLGDYLARLLAMNEQMNLTAIVEPAEAWTRHIFDALTLLPQLKELRPGARLADVGSGGGVPGIPLAIARPELAVTLIEATQKKATFLTAVATALGLSNVTVHAERAESLARSGRCGRFEVVTARAVGRLAALVPVVAPLVQPGGLLLLVKGQRADEELVAAKRALKEQGAIHERTVATPTGRIVVLRRALSPRPARRR